GITGRLDDPLYLFKKQFGKNTEFPFYVSNKIWNPKVYDALCEAVGVDKVGASFPAYRSTPVKVI
ncbi:MAG: GNAT family N-acetyltransferase, partial [Planococcus donghaensis]